VSLSASSVALKTGDTRQLTASVRPDNADNKAVNWSSSDPSVATVSGGLVTAVSPGSATIRVSTVEGGYTATCAVTVEERSFVVETPQPEGNKGSIEVSLNLPASGSFSCTFALSLPQGFHLDESGTSLAADLTADYQLDISSQGGNTWQFEIRQKSLRSLRAGTSYRNLVDVAYTMDESVSSGDYEVKLTDVELKMSDNTVIREEEIKVSVTAGNTTGILSPGSTYVYCQNGILTVNTPRNEQISVYSFSGQGLFAAPKPAGEASFSVHGIHEKILIISGSSGWVKKVVK
jgi:hypothetical protein